MHVYQHQSISKHSTAEVMMIYNVANSSLVLVVETAKMNKSYSYFFLLLYIIFVFLFFFFCFFLLFCLQRFSDNKGACKPQSANWSHCNFPLHCTRRRCFFLRSIPQEFYHPEDINPFIEKGFFTQ